MHPGDKEDVEEDDEDDDGNEDEEKKRRGQRSLHIYWEPSKNYLADFYREEGGNPQFRKFFFWQKDFLLRGDGGAPRGYPLNRTKPVK